MSHDSNIAEFNEYYSEMLWPAVPFASDRREALSEELGVEGIPRVIVLRGADGSVANNDARELINSRKKLDGIF